MGASHIGACRRLCVGEDGAAPNGSEPRLEKAQTLGLGSERQSAHALAPGVHSVSTNRGRVPSDYEPLRNSPIMSSATISTTTASSSSSIRAACVSLFNIA